MSVHYKFKNSVDYDTITFDGVHISVGDLKKAIIQQRKLGKSDCDYKITDAETKVVYGTDDTLVPKNSSVIICRVPSFEKKKSNWNRGRETATETATSSNDTSVHVSVSKITRASDRTKTTKGEDELIKDMIAESTEEYDSSHFARGDRRGLPGGPLPSNYVCYRCNQTGHHIKQCPTNNLEMKRSTGIPRSFMVPCDPAEKGAYMTPDGGYARPVVEAQAYSVVKVEKPPTMASNDVKGPDEPTVIIPSELTCSLCSSLLRDAVLISCCAEAACDDCIRNILIESDDHECPLCHTKNVPPDTLIPCIKLRKEVTQFLSETDPLRKMTMAKETPTTTVSNVTVAATSSKTSDSQTINSGSNNDKSNSNTLSSSSINNNNKSTNSISSNSTSNISSSSTSITGNDSSNNSTSIDPSNEKKGNEVSSTIDSTNVISSSSAKVEKEEEEDAEEAHKSPEMDCAPEMASSDACSTNPTSLDVPVHPAPSVSSSVSSSSGSHGHPARPFIKSVARRGGHMGPMGPPPPPPHMGPRGHNSESLLGLPPPPYGNPQGAGPPQMNGYYNGQSGYGGHGHPPPPPLNHPGGAYPPNSGHNHFSHYNPHPNLCNYDKDFSSNSSKAKSNHSDGLLGIPPDVPGPPPHHGYRDGGQANYGGPPSHSSQVNHPVLPFPPPHPSPYSSHNAHFSHPPPPHPPAGPYGAHGNLYNYDNFNSPHQEGKNDRSIVSLPESSTYGRINSLSYDQAFEEFQRALTERSSTRSCNRDHRSNLSGPPVRASSSSVRSSSSRSLVNHENSSRHTADSNDTTTSGRSGHSSKKSKKKKRSRSRSRSRDKSIKKSKKDKDRHRDKDEKKEKSKKDEDKERDRDKDKDKDKDKDRDRERDRDKIKIKDKDKSRDKDRERKKDSDKEKHREKDKDKEKDKDRDKERERKPKKV